MANANGTSVDVTVVIPVWNVGPYIGRCIESLKAQTHSGLEFIFVDDCGTDDSMAQVEAFAAQDVRVVILHNASNAGTGVSRNRGIEHAQGNYLSFVDPDDSLAPDFYELLLKKARETDSAIVKGRAVYSYKKAGKLPFARKDANTLIRRGLAQGLPLWKLFKTEHWSAIYRRDLFLDGTVRYGLARHSQDLPFQLRACYAADSFALEDNAHYYYCRRDGSATKIMTPNRFLSDLYSLSEQVEFIAEHDMGHNPYSYLGDQIMFRIDSFCNAAHNDVKLRDMQAEYSSILQQLISVLPSHEPFLSYMPEVAVVAEYGRLIPRSITLDREVPLTLWTDLFLAHPGCERRFARGYAVAIGRFLFGNAAKKDPVRSLAFVRTQLLRLPAAARRQILQNLPGSLTHLLQNRVSLR